MRAIVVSTMIDFYGIRLRMYPHLHHQNLLLYYLLSLPPSFLLQTSHQVYQSYLHVHKHSIA
jgi:cytochrome c-type biogenesis protein CcmH/NrfF